MTAGAQPPPTTGASPTARWVLGLDVVSSVPGAALWRDGFIVGVRERISAPGAAVPGRRTPVLDRPGDRIAACVFGLLEEAGITISALSGVAATVGPGSFTGIRVGLAFLHGLLQGTTIAVAAVGTFPAARDAWRVEGDAAASRGEKEAASAVVMVRLRRTDWFVEVSPGEDPRLEPESAVRAAADAAASAGRRVLAVGPVPSGVREDALPRGLSAATARLGAAALKDAGWPRMTTAERVRVLAPEYRRGTYVTEARPR